MSAITSKQWRIIGYGVLIAVVVGLLALLVFSGAFKHRIDQVAAWTIHFAEANPVRGAVLFLLFSAVSAMLAFASSVVLVPPAVAVWGKFGTFSLLLGGWTLGAALAYAIGRLMTPLLNRLGYSEKLAKYRQYVSTKMKFWAVLLFCIAVPSEVPGYLFGAAHYSFIKFIVAITLAESIYAFGVVVIGEKLLEVKPSAGIALIGLIIAAIVGIGALRRYLKIRAVPKISSS